MINLQEKLRLFLGLGFLTRLRRVLLIFSFGFFSLWLGTFLLFPKIFPWLLSSYFYLLGGKPLIFISIEEPLLVALRASFYLTLIALLPLLLLKLWGLVSEELYEYEQRFFKRLFLLSLILSLLGLMVGYWVLFPLLCRIFLYFGQNFMNNLRVAGFLFFLLKTILFSVIIFQMPLIFALTVKEGLITGEVYRRRRLYFLSIFYGISFLIAPTDLFSQVLLTLFFFLFFKLSFLIARLL